MAPWRRHAERWAAVKFPEYLSGDEAQKYFADSNSEYQAGPGQPGDSGRELVPNSEARTNSDRRRQVPAQTEGSGRHPENIALILPDSD